MLEASNVKLEQMREIIREKDQIIQVWNLKPKMTKLDKIW